MTNTAGSPDLDLTPRTGSTARSRSKWVPLALLAAIAVAVVGLIWFLITNSQAFLEADVAVAERVEQGDKRFQLLGSPVSDADPDDTVLIDGAEHTPFTVAFDDVLVDVVSQGTPPDLFAEGVPVVLEGHWVQGPAPAGVEWPEGANDGWYFDADRVLVKHDEDYRNERIEEAEDRGRLDT